MDSLISIVIPLFNKEKYIQRAIKSVLAQVYQNFEIIVVNDGSTDQSLARVMEISDPRLIILSQPNRGVSSARNLGVKNAHSDIVAFLDADDEWYPDFLLDIVDLHEKYSDCGLFGLYYQIIDQNGNSVLRKGIKYTDNWEGKIVDYFNDLALFGSFCSSSVAVKKNILNDIGGFPENIKIREDVNTWIRLSLITSFSYKHKVGSIVHWDANNRSSERVKTNPDLIYNHADFLTSLIHQGKIPQNRIQSTFDLIAKYSFPIISYYLSVNNTSMAVLILKSCWRTKLYRRQWCKFLWLTGISLGRNLINQLL